MPQQLASVFAALGDPTRLAIIQRLAAGEASVQELAEPFDISAPAISRHLKVLEQAGLISRGREAQFRPCRLEREKLEEIRDWTKRMRCNSSLARDRSTRRCCRPEPPMPKRAPSPKWRRRARRSCSASPKR